MKRGGFQGAAFLRYTPAQNARKRNRAAPHCDWRYKQRGYISGRAIFDFSPLYREGGMTPSSSLRSRQRLSALQPAIAPRPSSASQPPRWLDANSCKPVAAISEPGPRFQSAILAYVILQLSLCRRAKFLRLRRARSTAADISTPRGCASCAHLRGVYLSFSKAPSCQ